MAGNETGLKYIFTLGESGLKETLVFKDGRPIEVDSAEFLGADPDAIDGPMADAVAAVHNRVVAANNRRG